MIKNAADFLIGSQNKTHQPKTHMDTKAAPKEETPQTDAAIWHGIYDDDCNRIINLCRRLELELIDAQYTLDCVNRVIGSAQLLWQKQTGKTNTLPGTRRLILWLIDERRNAKARLEEQMDYAGQLQKCIEVFCKDGAVPYDIAKGCPWHANMLNKFSK